MKEPGLPTRMQAEGASLPLGWGTAHSTRATSWATGLSQSVLPLAPDTAAAKVQGEEKPVGRDTGTSLLQPPGRWAGQPQHVLCQTYLPHTSPRPQPLPPRWIPFILQAPGALMLTPPGLSGQGCWRWASWPLSGPARKGDEMGCRNTTICFPQTL